MTDEKTFRLWLQDPPGTHTHIGLMASTTIKLEDPMTVRVERHPTDGSKPRGISLQLEVPVTADALSTPVLNDLRRLASLWGEDLDSELRISDAVFKVRASALFKGRVP